MAKSSTIGLLKNVSTAAGSACPRQEAAQIIYNALTLPILEANQLGVLIPSNETILTKYLGVEVFTGVIVANEVAGLDGDAIDAGTTAVKLLDDNQDITNTTKVFDFSTGLDDLGESVTIYGKTVVKGTNEALFVVDSGLNTTYNNDGAAIANATGLAKASGMSVSAAEYFVNYDEATKTPVPQWTSEGVLSGFTAFKEKETDSTSVTSYKAGDTVSEKGYQALLDAYNNNTLTIGTTNGNKLASDNYSWKVFVGLYLTEASTTTYDTYTGNGNGTYVKVIDNNGDNKADYILRVNFVMDQVILKTSAGATINTTETVNGVTKNVVLSDRNASTAEVALNETVNVADGAELAADDVIVYANIEGTYYTNVITPVVDTVSAIDYKNSTFTGVEDEYAMSAIGDKTDMLNAVADLSKRTSYNLYEDLFGYVRTFIEAKYSDYVLLTEIYRDTTDRNNLISDKTYTVETVDKEGTVANYTVASGEKVFYTGSVHNYNTNGLNKAVTYSWTNVANAAIDGTSIDLASVEAVYNYKTAKTGTKIYDLTAKTDNVAADIAKGQRYFNFTNDNGAADYVNVTANTQVYFVYGKGTETEITKVEVGTGYSSIPALAGKGINAVYAVATTTRYDSTGAQYPVADVLVIEINKTYEESFVFAYENYNGDVESILADGTIGDVDGNASTTYTGFYNTLNGEITTALVPTADYKANNIVAAEVFEIRGLGFINVHEYSSYNGTASSSVTTVDYTDELPVYAIKTVPGSTRLTAENITYTGIRTGDDLIIVWSSARHSGTPVYIIDVTRSDASAWLSKLLSDIQGDEVKTCTVTLDGVVIDTVTSGDSYTAPKKDDADGTGYLVEGLDGVSYVAYGGTIDEVKDDITLTTGYVSWTLNTEEPVAVEYAKKGTTDINKYLTATGKYVRILKTATGTTAIRAVDGKAMTNGDATFVDGLYKVTMGADGTYTANKAVYDEDGNLVAAETELDAGKAYYAKEGTVFTKLLNGTLNGNYTVTDGADAEPFK
jgi:hypothetical protein